MYQSVEVKRFKGLSNATLRPLARVNLIGGTNNAGKTSILEAIFLALDRLNGELFLRQYNWRGTQAFEPNESLWLPFFPNFDTSEPIEIGFDRKSGGHETVTFAAEESTGSRAVSADPLIKGINPLPGGTTSRTAFSLKIEARRNEAMLSSSRFVVSSNGFQHIDQRVSEPPVTARALFRSALGSPEDVDLFSRIELESRTPILLDALRSIDARLESLSVLTKGGMPMLYAGIKGLKHKLPLAFTGDGMKRMTSVLLTILAETDGVILIDEIENGIHYSKFGRMWESLFRAAESSRNQVFVTTHSYECVRAAGDVLTQFALSQRERSLAYFRIQGIPGDASTHVERYSSEELLDSIDSDVEIR